MPTECANALTSLFISPISPIGERRDAPQLPWLPWEVTRGLVGKIEKRVGCQVLLGTTTLPPMFFETTRPQLHLSENQFHGSKALKHELPLPWHARTVHTTALRAPAVNCRSALKIHVMTDTQKTEG